MPGGSGAAVISGARAPRLARGAAGALPLWRIEGGTALGAVRVVVGAGVTRVLVGSGPRIAPVTPGRGVAGPAVVGRGVGAATRGTGVGDSAPGSRPEKASSCDETSSS